MTLVTDMPISTIGCRYCRRVLWRRSPEQRLPSRPMLTISQALLDKVIAHARADHPDEACGIIAGPAQSGRPERFIAMTNAERSPTFYRFDSMEQLKVWREMDDRDEEPVVIYHSHTATEAYPYRHLLRERARRALPAGLDLGAGSAGGALVPDHRRRGQRGRGRGLAGRGM